MSTIKDKKPRDKNGLPHGEWIVYYSNGKLDYRRNYVHGISHGLWEEYHKDGDVMYRGYWNMGRYVGYWYYSLLKNRYFLCLI